MAVQTRQTQNVRDLIASGGLRAHFQPIVDLGSQAVVGYEALARGPVGSPLEMPDALFGAAREADALAELDRACRSRAIATAIEAGLGDDDLLFLNVEPAGLGDGGVLDRTDEDDLAEVSVVVELTERALTARPKEVLGAVRWLRRRGCRIALDDVGIDPRSLGLMPFVSPDVIKLDRRITQSLIPEIACARVINAVRAEAERSGAIVLAEGIETEQHLRRAEAMGARFGQGWLFGRPGPLEVPPRRERRPRPDSDPRGVAGLPSVRVPRREPEPTLDATPFEQIATGVPLIRGDKSLLLSLSRQLEQEADAVRGEAVVLATFQDARFFTPLTRRRYERIARGAALVGAIGVGLAETPGAGLRGASIDRGDRLEGEWDVVVIGPHFAGAFVARDLGDGGADRDRQFEYFMTYDRELVARAARPLLSRLIRSQ
jgi:EAL domain-containing protein (putative c-di-GMP-specific phosphodiesterase class I)